MVTREDMVLQSSQDFIKARLTALGYDEIVDVRESFPTSEERSSELTKTQVAVGFNFDDGGTKMEMGSNLTRRVYTTELFTFGLDLTQGRNIASVLSSILEGAGLIPLKNIEAVGQPVIDQLVILDDRGVTVERQIANDPQPWDRFVFNTTAKVEDVYVPVVL